MSALTLPQLLPNLSSGLDGSCFFFGAGTSVEAGYPMMSTLTREVVGALTTDQRTALDDALGFSGKSYDNSSASPNIEEIADIVIAQMINSGDVRFSALEARIRQLITDRILAVTSPTLDYHQRFFEALRKRAFGLSCCVYIFTTNYDILLETAAALSGVAIETGFCGATDRFFDPGRFHTICGRASPGRFTREPGLTVRLIKLHGSVSWTSHGSTFYERHPEAIASSERRVMILPRRQKVLDTLAPPYDALFGVASRFIGNDCKYIVSCGFSFGDEHINQTLIEPNLRANRCRLFALCKDEPAGISAFKSLPAFSAGFETGRISSGVASTASTDAWKFSQFVELFA